ncbi:hypothetical protein BIW11_06502 [Tropilaelaps mercedesae]|uniref:C2H2-type domain-containing protein n=1 Tax=Tropilaelaps mercedesae TaxID=418985 RepID=A0A1V9XY56_9ACAR|nr:hypothetical protein BIW11_06502 [Tropilaelaps mercedesae]
MLAPRFQLEVGSRVELEEAGVWYPVRVVRGDSERVLVHFEGWSPRYDRWIDRNSKQIRARRRFMMKRKRRSAAPSAANSEEDNSKDRDTIKERVSGKEKDVNRDKESRQDCKEKDSTKDKDHGREKDINKDKDTRRSKSTPRERRSVTTAAAAEAVQAQSSQKKGSPNGGTSTRTSSGALQRRFSGPVGRRATSGHLKVAGVFRAGIRRTARKSIEQLREKESNNKDVSSVDSDKDAKSDQSPVETPLGMVPPTAAPPVGWAYEVVTKAEDLVPKKAFTINEDHNEFKCTRPDCNKSFRKEKLLASHLKHYHNISTETEQSQKPQSPKRESNEIGYGEEQPAMKRRRGRRSRTEIEEALRTKEQQELLAKAKETRSETGISVKEPKETTADLATESSSSTDISNATIVDHQLDHVEHQQQPAATAIVESSVATGQSVTSVFTRPTQSSTGPTSPSVATVTGPTTGTATTTTPAGILSTSITPALQVKTPLYGRVGQNRFVPIPEPLVLGREKRKVVKTERMQEAEGVLLRRSTQPRGANATPHGDTTTAGQRDATNQKEQQNSRDRRRRSHPEAAQVKDKSVEEFSSPVEETLEVILRSDHTASDDDEGIATSSTGPADRSVGQQAGSTNSAHTSPHGSHYRSAPESFVEKDMVHCMCDVDEESGLMMQCDICLCWQHGSCFGIESEQLVPERYVCVACANARRVWAPQAQKQAGFRAMAEGRLPGLAPGLPVTPSPRFINLARVAEVMAHLKRGMRGVERRVERIARDSSIPPLEKRILLAVAAGDVERAHRQLDACERIVEAIDRPAGDGGACSGTSEALILRSTVKSVLKDLAAVQRLTLYK